MLPEAAARGKNERGSHERAEKGAQAHRIKGVFEGVSFALCCKGMMHARDGVLVCNQRDRREDFLVGQTSGVQCVDVESVHGPRRCREFFCERRETCFRAIRRTNVFPVNDGSRIAEVFCDGACQKKPRVSCEWFFVVKVKRMPGLKKRRNARRARKRWHIGSIHCDVPICLRNARQCFSIGVDDDAWQRRFVIEFDEYQVRFKQFQHFLDVA